MPMRVLFNADYPLSGDRVLLYYPPTEATLDEAVATVSHLVTAAARPSEKAHPTLAVFRMKEPAISLGRFQNAHVALNTAAGLPAPVVRRLTGGPAAWMGAGSVYLALVIPNWPLWLPAATVRGLPKLVQDMVLGALRKDGFSLSMSAADSVTKRGFEVGRMGFDVLDHTIIVELQLGMTEAVTLPEEHAGYPALSEDAFPRRTKHLAELLETRELPAFPLSYATSVAEALFRENFEVRESAFSWLERTRVEGLRPRFVEAEAAPASPATSGPELSSRPHEDYIGFVHATVTFNAQMQFTSVRIFGDFLADSPGIAELEHRLRFTEVSRRNIAQIIDEVLGAPHHVILGLKRLGSVLEALMDAAARHDRWDVMNN